MSKQGFIQIQRASEELFENDLDAYLLMSQIMFRAMRTNSKYNKHNLKVGQACVGDYKSIGLTEQRYRDAKDRIENRYKLAKFEGNNKGTIATLLSTEFCDINADDENSKNNSKERTENGQVCDKKDSKQDSYKEKSPDENGQRTNKERTENEQGTSKERTENGQGTTKEECNNVIMKETTTPLPPKGDPVVVDFYECLKSNKELNDDEKETLQKYPENRVKLALEFSKTEKPTTTLMQMLVWHCREKIPPKPKSKRMTDQQRMALEFNAYLLSIGMELMYHDNLKNIEEGLYMIIPIGGGVNTVSLTIPPLELKKDFEMVKKEQTKLKYG